MSAPPLDGRRADALAGELLRRAEAVLSPDGVATAPGSIAKALLCTAGRMFEEVTRRIDRVPEKQADNFYTAMGLSRSPARPARVAVAFKLADPALANLVLPAATRLSATAGDVPVAFETEHPIELAGGSIAALAAIDVEHDRVFLSPPGVAGGALPRPQPLRRSLVGGAAAGADTLQIEPAVGMEPGMVLRLGRAPDAPQHRLAAVEGGMVKIDPPLGAALDGATPIVEIGDFDPFAGGSHDLQSHSLYLSHPTLLDASGEATITVSGVRAPVETRWDWWGKADPAATEPAWQPLTAQFADGRFRLLKGKGKPEARDVDGRPGLWLRASLPGASSGVQEARDVRLSIATGGRCGDEHTKRCDLKSPAADPEAAPVGYEAIAVTTPIVPNNPYYPFGREPRVFDAFYIGSSEAFGKNAAEISLCFTLGGPKLGRLAAFAAGQRMHVFGVGGDGEVYRAVLTEGNGQLAPMPRQGEALKADASVAAGVAGDNAYVAVARERGIDVATFPVDAPVAMTPGTVHWASLNLPPDAEGGVESLVALVAAPPVFAVLAGGRLYTAAADANGPLELLQGHMAEQLAPLEGLGTAIFTGAGNDAKRYPFELTAALDVVQLTEDPLGGLALAGLAALGVPDPRRIYLAAFQAEAGKVGIYDIGIERELHLLGREIECEPGPLAFEPPHSPADVPSAVVATARPTRLTPVLGADPDNPRDLGYVATKEPYSIGLTDRLRNFVRVGDRTVVAGGDLGLLHRSGSAQRHLLRIDRRLLLVREGDVPIAAAALYATLDGAERRRGEGFAFEPQGAFRVLQPIPPLVMDTPARDSLRLFELPHDGRQGTLSTDGQEITVAMADGKSIPNRINIAIPEGADIVKNPRIWEFSRSSKNAAWTAPDDFRWARTSFDFVLLAEPEEAWPLVEAVSVRGADQVERWLAEGPLEALGPVRASLATLDYLRDLPIALLPNALFPANREATELIGPPPPWRYLGPDEPANPALSWEYWNGRTWWSLESQGLVDRTGHLQSDGGVFFTVPADLAETEVGGRRNRWVRARLIGGDFGEARVTVETAGGPPPAKQQQTVTRDLSAIRAPYVIKLEIGYCVIEPVAPEAILTVDNLGTVERTGANGAGLPFPVFAPIAEAMNPAPPPSSAPPEVPELCSPCEPAGPAPAREQGGLPTPGFARAILIGFDQAVRGVPLSLYADAAPGGGGELAAEVLCEGRFQPLTIVADDTQGLSEPGIVLISLPAAPDRATLLGREAHWLRLHPAAGAAAWAPRLRGLYLNAASALSAETRENESVGTSSGEPAQHFRLAEAPVEAGSLALFVREEVSADDARGRLVLAEIEGRPGPWVQWHEEPELSGADGLDRRFTLDGETGEIRFGDGIEGMAPPVGAAILARHYRRITGAAANGVPPGQGLDPLSPIAGLENIVALDLSAGGSDIETAAEARRRASAKLRHGQRLLTLRDLEDFALARFSDIVQARASVRRGGVRLVVVGAGERVVPLPAALREIGAALRESASYGLAAPGRLSVVGPRLLPIAIALEISPDRRRDLAGLVQEAETRLVRFFDCAVGGLAGEGWPVGRRPDAVDAAAALAPLADRCVVREVSLSRADRDTPQALPDPLPTDVLVHLSPGAVRVTPAAEAGR